MAEAVVFGIAERIVTDLGSLLLQEVGSSSAHFVNKELRDLEDTLSTIKALLLHAEDMQMSNPEVKEWLRRIKDAVYEADDVVDDFSIQAQRKNLLVQYGPMGRVRYFVSSSNPFLFRFKMAHRIKQIKTTLTRIAVDKSFQLEKRIPDSERVHTHSHVNESRVLGREGDKEKIVELLLDFDGPDHLTILPVHGLGGLGKTTLAQLVYNDDRIDVNFEPKMWVCVSEKFDVDKVLQSIIESATKKICPKLKMDLLQSTLREELKGKRFLLVLDDVWNEDAEKWDILKELLLEGARGSKIIVTTRSQKVASIMKTISTYHLLGLSDDNCWNLFKQRAFETGVEERHPNLVKIGHEIVGKCGGVPLAAKTLGSLMLSNTKERDWINVRNSDVWRLPQKENDILPALRLSYNQLPFPLRQCFAYCSMFPKGYQIQKIELIRLWIAQGFIVSSGENQTLEEIGSQYVEDLMWRSFFQEPEVNYNGDVVILKMHGLVHDLAQSVAGMECFTITKNTQDSIPQGVRHLCVDEESFPLETFDILRKTPNIRTLIVKSKVTRSMGNIFSASKFLRVLILKNFCNDCLPNSIGKLKHLRYLEIVSQSVTRLPKSIAKLQSLLYLVIGCEKLVELPRDIENMSSLRVLSFKSDSPLMYMPSRIGRLTNLQILSAFVVGKRNGGKLNELNGLRNLGGVLVIKNIENVSSSRDSEEVNLAGKPELKTLILSWSEVRYGCPTKEETAFDVLGSLKPHENLERLALEGYEGVRFPDWMMIEEPLLPKVTRVILSKCRKCRYLPPLGQLKSLMILALGQMDALQFIESHPQTGGQKEWFPSLRHLYLLNLPILEGWSATKEGGAGQEETSLSFSLIRLVELTVLNCTKLRTMPFVPSLEKLELNRCCDILVQSILLRKQLCHPENSSTPPSASLAKLKLLNVKHCDDLVSLPVEGLQGLSSLLSLQISECERFTTLSDGVRYLTSLGTLILEKLPKLVSFPEEIQNATKLLTLVISDCEGLMTLPHGLRNLSSLRWLIIWNCPKLEALPDGIQLLTNLKCLKLHCYGLLCWPTWLGNLTLLREFWISCTSDLPEQLQHLTSLQILIIGPCESLVNFPGWIGNLSSLQRLVIRHCPCLQYLPEQMKKLVRLQYMEIWDCDKLTARCNKDTGEDWSKIAHAPTIKLNGACVQKK